MNIFRILESRLVSSVAYLDVCAGFNEKLNAALSASLVLVAGGVEQGGVSHGALGIDGGTSREEEFNDSWLAVVGGHHEWRCL